ncbi:MAG TPA: CYTH domain-containing protein [Steroidobacteraceae bacterium]|nr:CYTH domain-containing protein [Steroidobacteraceae bacterium]
MSVEIERKFLVRDDRWRAQCAGRLLLRQGYLANTARCSLRVRVAGGRGWLSAKAMREGRSRTEFEYPIPAAEAEDMLAAFVEGPVIEKLRHRVGVDRHCFELDEFRGANLGLVVAEIELAAPDEEFPRPPWLGEEVTDDGRFHNFRLVTAPFSTWPATARAAVAVGRAPPRDGA